MDAEISALQAGFGHFSRDAVYARGAVSTPIKAFARGLKADELIAAADQFDRMVVMLPGALEQAGLGQPQRFDRITLSNQTFVVFDHRPAPAVGEPAFIKLMVKGGGSQ